MPCYVLFDASERYYWASQGGFVPMESGLSPHVYPDRKAAELAAQTILAQTGQQTHPALVRLNRKERS